ncbi:hypothetical protein HDV03_001934 [Kappamyces sp. JEL0829]|nr:hypothetical protein HDV03_001934 [Kappamyces sp. JEL0829]
MLYRLILVLFAVASAAPQTTDIFGNATQTGTRRAGGLLGGLGDIFGGGNASKTSASVVPTDTETTVASTTTTTTASTTKSAASTTSVTSAASATSATKPATVTSAASSTTTASSTVSPSAAQAQVPSSNPSSTSTTTNLGLILGLVGGVVVAAMLGIYIFRKSALKKSNTFQKRLDPDYAPTMKSTRGKGDAAQGSSSVPKMDEYLTPPRAVTPTQFAYAPQSTAYVAYGYDQPQHNAYYAPQGYPQQYATDPYGRAGSVSSGHSHHGYPRS